jgi:hypothetical protein
MEEKKDVNMNSFFESVTDELQQFMDRLGDACPLLASGANQGTKDRQVVIVHDSPCESLDERMAGQIHSAHLNHPVLEYLIKRSSSGEFSVDMDEAYEDFDKEVFSYRFIDPFEEGEIADLMAHKVSVAGFDPLPLRTHFTALMGYVAHHVKTKNVMLPIDVQLGVFQGSYVIQVAVSAHRFLQEHLRESFQARDLNHPYRSFIKDCYDSCHIFDVTAIKSPEKVLFTSVWCHDQYKLPSGTFLFNQLESLKDITRKNSPSVKLKLIEGKESAHFHDLHLSGTSARRYEGRCDFDVDHPYLAEQAIEHCLKKIENVGDGNVENENIAQLLNDFEEDESLEKLSQRDWDFVRKALEEPALREEFKETVTALTNEVDDEVFEKVISSISRMKQDSVQVVSGQNGAEDEATTIVKGQKEKAPEKLVVKGSHVDPLSDKGNFNLVSPSQWEEAKNDLVKKVREQWSVKESTTKEETIQDIARLISGEIGVDGDRAQVLVKETFDGAIDEVAGERLRVERQQIMAKNQERYFKQEIIKRDKQIIRMKSILDQIKKNDSRNTSSFLANNEAKVGEGDTYRKQAFALQAELEQVEKKLREKELSFERETEVFEGEIEDLKKKLSFYKDRSEDVLSNENELKRLQKENEQLKNQARLGADRMEQMHDRIKSDRNTLEQRDERKLQILEQKLVTFKVEKQKAKEQMNILEQNNIQLKKECERLLGLVEESEGLQEKRGEESGQVESLKREIQIYVEEKRKYEHEAKKQYLKIKQLEQKLKFLTVQLEKGTARIVEKENSSQNNANEQRLEKLNQKLVMSMNKQSRDLNDRKKELIKLKAENNQLQNRLNEVERILAKTQKAS